MERNYISENLKLLRKKKGVSQTELARTLGIPLSTYNAYETGQNIPRFEVMQAIADYYNRTVQYIFFRRIAH